MERPIELGRVTSDDTSGLVSIGFELFSRGRDRRLEMVYAAPWQGSQVHVFDYYCKEDDDSTPRFVVEARFAAAAPKVLAAMPPLTVARESIGTAAADAVGLDDLAVELEEFNRAFEVRCADPAFANAFLDQRMIRFLMASDPMFTFETRGRWLLVYGRDLPRSETFAMLETLSGFRDHVPAVVANLYGPSATG
jgi:hypothetical protein